MVAGDNSGFFDSQMYRKAMTDSGDLIAVMDERYAYLFVSKAFMHYLGLRKANIMGHAAPEILGEELFKKELKPYIDKSLLGRRTTFQMSLHTSRLDDRFFHLICYPVVEKGVRAVVVVARDITRLKRREQALQWYQQIFRIVLEKAADILLLMDPDGIITSCSRYVDRQTGLSSNSVIGQSVRRLFSPESYEKVVGHLEDWKRHYARYQSWEAEVIGRSGEKVPFEVHSTPVYEQGKLKWVVVIARNILKRKTLEEELKKRRGEFELQLEEITRQSKESLQKMQEEFRNLSSKILEDQERERNAIGRELHDELGGYLTILGIYLGKLSKEPDKSKWLEQFTQTMDEMVQYVRSLSHALYPAMLERGDLQAALENYFGSYQRRTGIKVHFTHKGLPERLPLHIEVAAYRIIQEALTNVAKHAGAEDVKVAVMRLKNVIKLSIEDKGRGFDVTKVSTKEAYGISGMKNRALFVGGNLLVTSAPGQGTVIACTLPIVGIQELRPSSLPLKE